LTARLKAERKAMKKKIKIVGSNARANPFYRSLTLEISAEGMETGIASIAVCVAATGGGFDVFCTYNGEEGEINVEALQGRSLSAGQAADKWRSFCDFYEVK
jgi:hypothetical protein